MPPFLHVMNTCEAGFREFLFQQMGSLVSIVKQHIRDYLDDVFVLINKYWNSNLLIPIINLVEEVSADHSQILWILLNYPRFRSRLTMSSRCSYQTLSLKCWTYCTPIEPLRDSMKGFNFCVILTYLQSYTEGIACTGSVRKQSEWLLAFGYPRCRSSLRSSRCSF